MFKEVKSNPDFPKLENLILNNWKKNNTVNKYTNKS